MFWVKKPNKITTLKIIKEFLINPINSKENKLNNFLNNSRPLCRGITAFMLQNLIQVLLS